jgi:ribonuclease P protein component
VYYTRKETPQPQIAISVSKRYKTAVERNYEKRVVREIMRDLVGSCRYLLMLIVVKTPARDLLFAQKKEQINYLIKKTTKENQIHEQ